MGSGDLNMKKSWHPLLHTNQERVWLQEKKALEERKKVAELSKEKEQERAVQELQKLQAESGGGKREERVDWMYAAPAEGNGPNAEELELYLLGKKRVDKLLRGNEEKLMAQAPTAAVPGGSFTSVQNANSARDTAAKIREDPLLAIKRQEQMQYEKILRNPKRLKELRAAREATMTPAPGHSIVKKSKKDETKEERRIRKEGKREREKEAGGSRDDGGHKRSREGEGERSGSSRRRSRSLSPRRHDDREDRKPRHDERDDRRPNDYDNRDDRSRYDDRRSHHDDRRDDRDRYQSSSTPRRPRSRSPPPPPRESLPPAFASSPDVKPNVSRDSYSHNSHRPSASHYSDHKPQAYRRPDPPAPSAEDEAARKAVLAARLADMQSSASTINDERNARLARMEAEDKAQLEGEDTKRESERKGGVGPTFLREQEKKVFTGGMDLGERMKRSGRVGMVGDRN